MITEELIQAIRAGHFSNEELALLQAAIDERTSQVAHEPLPSAFKQPPVTLAGLGPGSGGGAAATPGSFDGLSGTTGPEQGEPEGMQGEQGEPEAMEEEGVVETSFVAKSLHFSEKELAAVAGVDVAVDVAAAANDDDDADTNSTNSSNRFVGSGTLKAPLISVQVQRDANIVFSTTSVNRPNTAQGSTQGDHITAYAMIIDAVLRSINNQPQSKIKILLRNIADHFLGIDRAEGPAAAASAEDLPTEAPAAAASAEDLPAGAPAAASAEDLPDEHPIDKIFTEFTTTVGILSDRAERAEFIELIRLHGCKDKHLEDVKQQLKFSKAIRLAKLIQASCEYVLRVINARDDAVVFSYYKKSSSDLNQEAYRVRVAISALRAFDYTLDSIDSIPPTGDYDAKLTEICGEKIRCSLKAFNVSISTKKGKKQKIDDKENIKRFVDIVKSVPDSSAASQDAEMDTILASLASNIAELFDFDYHTQMMNRIFSRLKEHAEKEKFEETVKALTQGQNPLSAQATLLQISQHIHEAPGVDERVARLVELNSELGNVINLTEIEEELMNEFINHANRHFSFAAVAFPTMPRYCLSDDHRKATLIRSLANALIQKTKWKESTQSEALEQGLLNSLLLQSGLIKPIPPAEAAAEPPSAKEDTPSSKMPGI